MCGAPKRVFETQLLICENVNLFVHGFFLHPNPHNHSYNMSNPHKREMKLIVGLELLKLL